MLACAEGDRHTLGLSLVEVALREAGWATLWAGQDTPAAELAALAREKGVEMIAVSASAAAADAEALRRQADVLGDACAASGVGLGLGGSGPWPDAPRHGQRFHGVAPFVERARELAAAAGADD
jgi:methanogenic corrinoid protein MtbC1